MNPFENKALRTFCGCETTDFNAAFEYTFNPSTKVLSVLDTSTFPAGQTFQAMNIWVIDSDGNEQSKKIATSDGNTTFDLSENFNTNEGFTITANVVSSTRKTITLTVRRVGLALNSGEGSINQEN
ncbi:MULTISPECIES: hypothetical protein [Chryseobacterium]|uniref:Uncharacterized protein n=1 Tax=Chryseobacterium gambrini TaxID=373672 RepID=A0A1N7LDZ9_9FLAO|nr:MULTISPECIES: hypothetical protein [Chryseobacterium]SIS72064.1 hypothetical protein SAMN05421785_102172 [Chryseobacterium gambrini]